MSVSILQNTFYYLITFVVVWPLGDQYTLFLLVFSRVHGTVDVT